jgi:hypothetical protein
MQRLSGKGRHIGHRRKKDNVAQELLIRIDLSRAQAFSLVKLFKAGTNRHYAPGPYQRPDKERMRGRSTEKRVSEKHSGGIEGARRNDWSQTGRRSESTLLNCQNAREKTTNLVVLVLAPGLESILLDKTGTGRHPTGHTMKANSACYESYEGQSQTGKEDDTNSLRREYLFVVNDICLAKTISDASTKARTLPKGSSSQPSGSLAS